MDGWVFVGAAVVLTAAVWLREPSLLYLTAAGAATLLAWWRSIRAITAGGSRPWPRVAVAVLGTAFCASAIGPQLTLRELEDDWPGWEERALDEARASLDDALLNAVERAQSLVELALAAPATDAAEVLAEAIASSGAAEEAVVLEMDGVPAAWAGTLRIPLELVGEGLSVFRSPFYEVLAATGGSEGRTAVATVLLHAHPPANALVRSVADQVLASTAVQDVYLEQVAPEMVPDGEPVIELANGERLAGRVAPLVMDEVELRTLERARSRGLLLLSLLVLGYLASAWGRGVPLPVRLTALGSALATVAVVPLNALSNVSQLFDPTFYYAPMGGPFTATVGALALSSGLVLLGLLSVLRARPSVAGGGRLLPATIVLATAGLGPFLLRDLARGIAAPTTGVTIGLWLAWQTALFLAATAVLLAGISAGRVLLRPGRGLPPYTAPLLAGVGALLAQPLWSEPGGWPSWYPALWIGAVAALALSRRTRTLVAAAASVAALGAMTLVWGSTVRDRVELAERDVAGLTTVDPVVHPLLERFADQLAVSPSPRTRAELLADYASSDLAAADFAVQMAAWAPDETGGGQPVMTLAAELADVARGAVPPGLTGMVADVVEEGEPSIRPLSTATGNRLVLALPHADGWVTTAAVAARTRLFPESPYARLILGSAPAATDPPYSISVAPVAAVTAQDDTRGLAERWRRDGDRLRGDWLEELPVGPVRVRVEVEMRALPALVERGALLLLLDLALVGILWAVAVVPEPALPRWLRSRWRAWSRSYRSRLSLALLAFFAIPALVFGVWASRQLQSDARQTRQLLVGEALRTAAGAAGTVAGGEHPMDEMLVRQPGEPPRLLYDRGQLVGASDELLTAMAPLGRTLPWEVAREMASGAPTATDVETRVGEARVLVGYQSLGQGERGWDGLVLAVPARSDELALDRHRRDLGVMLLLTIACGALGALWLSGVAGRQLARPIGTLRRAALTIAAGEREPPLQGPEPPAEFQPVFSAFRRMASDLSASQMALEEAERRTAAVLRQVASAVVAVDAQGVVTLFNPAAVLLLGRALMPGARLPALGLPEVDDLRARLERPGRTDGEDGVVELNLGSRQIHARLTPLPGGDGSVLTLDDVTELARAQRVLAWGEMARQVAHEIKNPLTPIRLGVQHLRRAYGRGGSDYGRVLDQNVERILAEIDRLDEIARAFSRYGTAPERRGGGAVDVSSVVLDVVELERMGAPVPEEGSEGGRGGVEWLLDGADTPRWGISREDELREVLLNLLENARLAGASTVRITLSEGRDGDGEAELRVVVTDDGHGIAADVIPRIFDPHFSTRTSGSGLGLAISRRLVQGWGGRIEVRSAVGTGTEVELTLAATLAP